MSALNFPDPNVTQDYSHTDDQGTVVEYKWNAAQGLWQAVSVTGYSFPEAPEDGEDYVRNNAQWGQADYFSGDYNDLANKPSIPGPSPSQKNSDWNATSGVEEILNKPEIKSEVTGPTDASPSDKGVGTLPARDLEGDVQVRTIKSWHPSVQEPNWDLNDGGGVVVRASANSSKEHYYKVLSNLDTLRNEMSAPKWDGTNANGTWGISITGTASNVTNKVASATQADNCSGRSDTCRLADEASNAYQLQNRSPSNAANCIPVLDGENDLVSRAWKSSHAGAGAASNGPVFRNPQGYVLFTTNMPSFRSMIGASYYRETQQTFDDYRIQTDVNPLGESTELIKRLNPVSYTNTEDGITRNGFIAHEVSAVIPDAVQGDKDATEPIGKLTDGNGEITNTGIQEPDVQTRAAMSSTGEAWTATGTKEKLQSIEYTSIVPVLVKALQEALTRIDELEAKMLS